MKKWILISISASLAFFVVSSCKSLEIDADLTRRYLEKRKFTNIKLGRYSPNCCSKLATHRRKFTATRDGVRYKGCVCRGDLTGYFLDIKYD